MPKIIKYDDNYEKTNFSYKTFMYISPEWKDNLYTIVEIIRNLKKSIIGYRYGKGQNTIKTYGSQYGHRIIGYTINNKDEYFKYILNGLIKFVFVFTDTSDTFITNLLTLCKTYNIPIICYSSIDAKYQLYESGKIITFTSVQDVIEKINELDQILEVKRITKMFENIDFIDESPNNSFPVLEKCMEKLKITTDSEQSKKDDSKIKFYDPSFRILKRHEYLYKKEHIKVEDPVVEEKKLTKGNLLSFKNQPKHKSDMIIKS